ncbi:hypothetical protein C8Q74DRAFT_1300094 [Fomes fomentarius]|nr:hypothetical protein C8Q74DRAFT_1300094 [Fomes fomentarius]
MILKLAQELETGRKLAQEAAMYSYLSSLQGTVVPRCYGYFRRTFKLDENPNASLSILLLEKLPGHIEKSVDLGSLKKSLIAMNEQLFDKQVYHCDLHYGNVMRACSDTTYSTASSYQYRFIDLEDAVWSNVPPAVRRRGFEEDIDCIISDVRRLDCHVLQCLRD